MSLTQVGAGYTQTVITGVIVPSPYDPNIGSIVPGPGGGLCKDAGGHDAVCRAQKTCKMKTNDGEFCAVCRDHVLKRIFGRVDLVRGDALSLVTGAPPTLHADLFDNAVKTTWSVDGTPWYEGATYQDLAYSGTSGDHAITLTVEHPTPMSRIWKAALREEMTATLHVP